MEPQIALQKAILAFGGYAAVARELGVTKSLVSHWAKGRIRVKAERVIPLEQIIGVPRHVIRPDLYPAESAELAE